MHRFIDFDSMFSENTYGGHTRDGIESFSEINVSFCAVAKTGRSNASIQIYLFISISLKTPQS